MDISYKHPDCYMDPDPYFEQYMGGSTNINMSHVYITDNDFTMDKITDNLLEFSQSIDPNEKNLIFDIDGTIFDSTAQCIDFKEGIRPYFNELLVRCHKNNYKIYIWTAGSRSHAIRIFNAITHNQYIVSVLCRGDSWFNAFQIEKKLRLLSSDIRNILLIENSHTIAIGQEDNVIIVPTYNISDRLIDHVMTDLIEIFNQIPSKFHLNEYVKYHLISALTDSYDQSLTKIVKIRHLIPRLC